MVKKALRKIGKERGYDVSESEKEMVFGSRFKMFDFKEMFSKSKLVFSDTDERKVYTLSYKPDVVWKKGQLYKAVFEIEYLDPQGKLSGKRKYAIGSLMLAYLAMNEKSIKSLIFITNNLSLYREIVTFKNLMSLKYSKNTHTLCFTADDQPSINYGLQRYIIKEWKI